MFAQQPEQSPSEAHLAAEPEFSLRAGRSCAAPESFNAEARLPSRRLTCSDRLGWGTVLARAYDDPAQADEFATAPTPDLLIVVNLSGSLVMESAHAGEWKIARYAPGSVGVTAPYAESTLRWRGEANQAHTSLHLHVSAPLLRDTAEALGRPHLLRQLPDTLQLEDPVALMAIRALWAALLREADALEADSIAQSLALHMVWGRMLRGPPAMPPAVKGALSLQALKRVIDYMNAHLGESVALDDLAAEALISKYHFLRLFTHATGLTPYRYLVRLRMERAAHLLRRNSEPVQAVALACGYASPGQFATAFRRHYGVTPSRYRRDGSR
jgi:AraC family transcriptional regulator